MTRKASLIQQDIHNPIIDLTQMAVSCLPQQLYIYHPLQPTFEDDPKHLLLWLYLSEL